jgi:hypothetical protein
LGKRLEQGLFAIALLSAIATLIFVGHAFFFSPQNPVAAEIGYEALRVARRLPLYVDPWKGAWEDGAPPARFYVLYTPIFPVIVGKLSGPTMDSVRFVGRTIAVISWAIIHILPVVFVPAPAPDKERRRIVAIAAMLSGGIYFISRHAASMSPDTLATMLVCLGVLRAVKKDRVDAIAAILIVAAPFIKPSCLGGIAGAGLIHLAQRRPGWIRSSIVAAITAAFFLIASHIASDGAWLSNISRSTGQPLTLTRWFQEFGSRSMVLGIPHLVLAWIAWRRKTTWLIVGPLLGSIAWTTFIMAKHGSGSHYWLEPTGLGLICIGVMPAAPKTEPSWIAQRLIPLGSALFALLVVILSWPQYLKEPGRYKHIESITQQVDAHCVRKPGEFVVSGDLMMELALNHGRISVPAWQSGFLARSGKFPADAWREDLARPEVRWVVVGFDPRKPPGDSNDEKVELSPFYDILKDTLMTNFDFDQIVAGQYVFKRKV